MPAAQIAAGAAALRTADEAIVAASCGDQPLEVEHGPALARGAVRREFVLVLVQPLATASTFPRRWPTMAVTVSVMEFATALPGRACTPL